MSNPIVGSQVNFPPKNSPLIEDDDSKAMTIMWYRTLQAFFTRTGGGNGIPTFNNTTVQDAGASQATATKLTPILNFVNSSGKGVVMPAALGNGNFLVVVNTTPSSALNVYPPPGGQINALGTNNPYVMNPGGAIAKATVQIFWFKTPLQCYATTLG